VSPEGLAIMEGITLFRRNLITTQVIVLNIFQGLSFALVYVHFCELERNIFDKLFHSLADL